MPAELSRFPVKYITKRKIGRQEISKLRTAKNVRNGQEWQRKINTAIDPYKMGKMLGEDEGPRKYL
jgi:hypothetical protein